jgi:hypothetical protein
MKIVDLEVFERFVKLDDSFGRLYEATKEWLKKCD